MTSTEPTIPGWYASESGNDHLIYLLLEDIDIAGVFVRKAQWMAFTRDGLSTECVWGYIDQAGPVIPMVKATTADA